MKKILKNAKFTFIIGILFASFSIVFASTYLANEVGFKSIDSNWTVENVKQATDSLYYDVSKKNPVGEIISFMGTIVPSYFLACNGTVYNINDYPKLAEHIKDNFGSYNKFGGNGTTTFAVPDLRGEFLRGWGSNSHSGMGSGSAVGTHQDATYHINIWIHENKRIYYQGNGNSYGVLNADSTTGESAGGVSINYSATASSAGNARYTARPTNTSVMYIIRYE